MSKGFNSTLWCREIRLPDIEMIDLSTTRLGGVSIRYQPTDRRGGQHGGPLGYCQHSSVYESIFEMLLHKTMSLPRKGSDFFGTLVRIDYLCDGWELQRANTCDSDLSTSHCIPPLGFQLQRSFQEIQSHPTPTGTLQNWWLKTTPSPSIASGHLLIP